MHKFVDLFSGIGGIRIAFESNQAVCVASSEIDTKARETYEINFGEKPLGDITKIKSSELPNFDILTAGFPCQPFSIGGLRKGFDDSRGTLFFEVARILKERKPKAFLLENVAGIVNHDQGNTLTTIENVLSDIGYSFKWKVMNSKDYGIPQNRNRWYCIGFLNELNISFDTENPQDYEFPVKGELEVNLQDLIESSVSESYNISEIAKKNILIFLDGFKSSKRYQSGQVIIANDIRPSRCGFRSDGIVPCLTAKMGTGGNNIPVLTENFRRLTERECLRIMGFPESFKIKERVLSSYKQIGNSVVVSVVDKLAREMIRVLDEKN